MDDAVNSALAGAARTVEWPLLVAVGARGGAPVVRWANPAAAELLGRDVAELVGDELGGLLPPRSPEPLAELLHGRRTCRWETDVPGSDGVACAATVAALPVPGPRADASGAESWWVVRVDPAAPGADTPHEDDRFGVLARRSPVPTIASDVGARLAHVNDAFARLLEVPVEDLLGTAWLDHVLEEDLAPLLECVSLALDGHTGELELRVRRSSGQVCPVRFTLAPSGVPGQAAGFIGTVEDLTERHAEVDRLSRQAHRDPLTGLPNRSALLDALADALVHSRPSAGEGAAVMLLDLDDFKLVNDGAGHEAGDALLVEVAARLRATVRAEDVVARLGGDEFVVLCHGLDGAAAVEAAAQRVLDAVRVPLDVGGVRTRPGASIGVVVLDPSHVTAEQVLRDADIAMYAAKSAGRGRWTVADAEAIEAARRSLRLVADLRQALAQHALQVVYQPVVSTDPQRRVVSVEALSRWRHPELGHVSPAVFVPLAERNNLVPLLDAHVLQVACRDMATWRARAGAFAPDTVAVNLSAVSLAVPGVAQRVQQTVEAAGLRMHDLCFEITETALVTDVATCRDVLEQLRRCGASVAVDDFGTGYSSLAYLRELPVDHLKVDRSFIADLCSSSARSARSARAVTTAVVALARALGLGTVAEGVETAEQAAIVDELGCGSAQGYLYSRPVSAEELLEMLLDGRPLPLPHRQEPRPAPSPQTALTAPLRALVGAPDPEVLHAAHR